MEKPKKENEELKKENEELKKSKESDIEDALLKVSISVPQEMSDVPSKSQVHEMK